MSKIVFDIEASSVNKELAKILQFSAIDVTSDNVDEWKLVANDYYRFKGRLVPRDAVAVNGLDEKIVDKLSNGLYIEEKPDSILNVFVSGNEVIGHNISGYDLEVINNNLKREGIYFENRAEVYDTYKNCSKLQKWCEAPNQKNETLFFAIMEKRGMNRDEAILYCEEVCRKMGASDYELHAHNALFDCVMSGIVYKTILELD